MEKLVFQNFNNYLQKFNIKKGAIMIVGIDNLREINSSLGIQMGDKILRNFSENILPNVNATSSCLMDNSDEFVILFRDVERSVEGERIFSMIQKEIIKECKKNSYFYTVSAGMVLFDESHGIIDTLLPCAEYALSCAKSQGKNCLIIFDEAQYNDHLDQMDLLNELKKSVLNNFDGFELYYQPIVSLVKKKMIGAEALLRWKNDKYPNAPLGRVISILEESGLIVNLGRFIVETAFNQAIEWYKIDPDFVMHINLSYVQFLQNNFLEQISLLAEKTNVCAQQVVFEITESGFVGNNKSTVSKQITSLSEMGFKIGLDDFGTGYSNFIYLKDMNVNIVKLDRAFIMGALNDDNKKELLKQIVNIAHSLKMQVCFEGVENPTDFDELCNLDPELVQGYCFGKPVDSKSFEAFFKEVLNQDALDKYTPYKKSDTSLLYLLNEINENQRMKKENKHFSHKVIASFLPILLVIFLALGISCYLLSRNILDRLVEDTMITMLDTSTDDLDSKFNETKNLAQTTGIYVIFSYKTATLESYEKMLQEVVDSNSMIAGTGIWFDHYKYQDTDVVCPYVYRKNGELITTYYYGGEDYNYFERDYFKLPKESLSFYISDPYYDQIMDNTIITFAYPMIDESGFIGVISVDLYLEDVIEIVQGLNRGSNTNSLLVTKDGTLICGFDNSPRDVIDSMSKEEGMFEAVIDNVEYKVYYDQLSSTGWKAAIMINTRGLYHSVNRVINIMIITFALIFLTAVTVILILLASIERQKKMEFSQKKQINQLHFNAIRSSYHIILVVNKVTSLIKVVYLDEFIKEFNLNYETYNQFISSLQERIEESIKSFYNIEDLAESLNNKPFFSMDIEFKTPDTSNHYGEIIISKVSNEDSENENEIMILVKDNTESKKMELEAQNEKQKLILQLQQNNRKLFKIGMTDHLTEVYNRSGLNYYANDILDKVHTNPDMNLFLLIADINKLKSINDMYGHLKGDEAIKESARILKEIFPNEMLVARTGGDEFVLLGAFHENEDIPHIVKNKIYNMINASYLNGILKGISTGYYWGKLDGGKDINYYYNLADVYMYKEKRDEIEK